MTTAKVRRKTTTKLRHKGSSRRFLTKVHEGASTKAHRGASASVRGNTSRRTDVRTRRKEPLSGTVVLKLGGELLEGAERMNAVARAIARASRRVPLVVIHGGGKEIDLALAQVGIPKQQVDGLRITDEATLRVVVAVLAGSVNTRLVAAVNAAGGQALGLTGADAGVAPVVAAKPHRATNGELVDLGLVGEPLPAARPALVDVICKAGFVPIIASIGATRDGALFNVNADTLAGSLASRLASSRLIVAAATPGVMDADGRTIAILDRDAIDRLIGSGTATAGMVAKLRACRQAIDARVSEVLIADGREPTLLAALLTGRQPRQGGWTRLRATKSQEPRTKNEEQRTKN